MKSELIQNKHENTHSPVGFAEFLEANPQIRNITFVFAHPDDIEGYAGGLVNRLAGINAGKLHGDKYSLNFVVVTDGANGAKNTRDRAELVRTRQLEQISGLQVLLETNEMPELEDYQQGQQRCQFTQPNASITFLNHPDSNIKIAKLETEIAD